MEISILIGTYNRKDKLEKTLLALNHQTFRDFEVIVGSDGSSDGTGEMLKALRHHLNYPVRLVHQADDGFRKTLILNKAATLASGRILVALDDDMIPPPYYLEKLMKKAGDRTVLFLKYLKAVPEDPRFSVGRLSGKTFPAKRNPAETIHLLYWKLKYALWLKQKHPRRPKLQGGNFCAGREIFLEINGYDCDFSGWGYEDDDLRQRLIRAGAVPKEEVLNGFCWNTGYRPQDKSKRNSDADASAVRNKALAYSGRPAVCANGIAQLNHAEKTIRDDWFILW